MAKLFKCDITGDVCDGEPAPVIEVAVGATLKAEIRLFKRVAPDRFGQADIGPRAAGTIAEILAGLAPEAADRVNQNLKP